MKFSYYPGCSGHATGVEYNQSTQAVFAALDVDLIELEDWNCCGASSAHMTDWLLALALPARNLAIAQEAGMDLVMPCAACFNRHKVADHAIRTDPEQRQAIEEVVEAQFTDPVPVRAPLDVVYNEVGLDRVKQRVKKPLEGLKVVPYYGCLLVRPPEATQFENPDHPTYMAELLESLGAEVKPWSYATDCCGGALSLTKTDVVAHMVGRLIERAREAGAEALVTACPLCQVNLEMRQPKGSNMPILYFTELMGLAFALSETKKWWSKHLIDPVPYLKQCGLL